MIRLLHQLILDQANHHPTAAALTHRQTTLSYAVLADQIQRVAHGLLALGLNRAERVAIYLPKRLEAVAALFGATLAGGVFVPVNPLLKPDQVAYILRDCNVRVLITARDRAELLEPLLADCPDLHTVTLIEDDAVLLPRLRHFQIIHWPTLLNAGSFRSPGRVIDADMAAILYTSGSTGKPKGVVLSHRNMLTGAYSVPNIWATGLTTGFWRCCRSVSTTA
jgi:acyl-CoA synthetase (AMP-forming)/AMP-acid ligase II